MDGFDWFIVVVVVVCSIAVLGLFYCVGADRVYQECKATGEYRVNFELKMKCEAVK